jgi:Protein of unknown function (DUF3592)
MKIRDKVASYIFLGLLVVLSLGMLHQGWMDYVFDSRCKTTTGNFIGDTYIRHKQGAFITYKVNYTYTVNGSEYTARDIDLTEDPGDKQTTQVFFDPLNPQDSRLDKGRGTKYFWIGCLLLPSCIYVIVDVARKPRW